MKTVVTLCIVCMLTSSIVKAQIPSLDEIKTEPVTATTGITFKLHSKILDEDRIICIALPEYYDLYPQKKYPVFYAVDGQWNFTPATQSAGWLSNLKFGMIPQLIVVTVHTLDHRERDLTPTVDKENRMGGGADTFYQFIKEELVPFVDKNYRTAKYKVLCGSSLGGVFVINALVKDPDFFNGYLATSPYLSWDNMQLLGKTKEFLSKKPVLHSRLYITKANEGEEMGVDALAALLKKYATKDFAWIYDKHPEEVHETINHKGIWDGMKFIFDRRYYLPE
jgi:predicted alpha/beta superfamily hydrolase